MIKKLLRDQRDKGEGRETSKDMDMHAHSVKKITAITSTEIKAKCLLTAHHTELCQLFWQEMSFSNIISVGTFVLSGSESSTAWLRKPSVCTVGKLLGHAFAEITSNLNQHNDFHFNRCWSLRFCSYLVSLSLLCKRKVSNVFDLQTPRPQIQVS